MSKTLYELTEYSYVSDEMPTTLTAFLYGDCSVHERFDDLESALNALAKVSNSMSVWCIEEVRYDDNDEFDDIVSRHFKERR